MTAVWLRSVCWRTRKNWPRWASASTTSGAPRLARGIAQRPDCRRRIGGAEDRRARHERRRAVLHERLREAGLHAPVHGDLYGPVAEEGLHLADLPVRARDERLAAEPWVDRHDEHQVEVIEHVAERVGRRGRVERGARLGAELADLGERALKM